MRETRDNHQRGGVRESASAGLRITRSTGADDVALLTELLHRAYADHAAAGRRFFASYQTVEDTRHRVSTGECWLAHDGKELVGTVTVHTTGHWPPGYPTTDGAGSFSQLAVDPSRRGTGLGSRLLTLAEETLIELGRVTAVIDTSSGADDLLAWYARKGYRPAGTWKWSVTNYESTVLHKSLLPPSKASR